MGKTFSNRDLEWAQRLLAEVVWRCCRNIAAEWLAIANQVRP